MENQIPVLLAKVLVTGKGCPVCGGQKTERARTCRACYNDLGVKISQKIDEFAFNLAQAAEGNAAAILGGVERKNVSETVFAGWKIPKNAKLHNPGNGIEPYYECQIFVKGGALSVFVFGNGFKPGDQINGLVEVKTKKISLKEPLRTYGPNGEFVKDMDIHYVRIQTVSGLQSDVRLTIGKEDECPSKDDQAKESNLPAMKIRELGRSFSIFFKAVSA